MASWVRPPGSHGVGLIMAPLFPGRADRTLRVWVVFLSALGP